MKTLGIVLFVLLSDPLTPAFIGVIGTCLILWGMS